MTACRFCGDTNIGHYCSENEPDMLLENLSQQYYAKEDELCHKFNTNRYDRRVTAQLFKWVKENIPETIRGDWYCYRDRLID